MKFKKALAALGGLLMAIICVTTPTISAGASEVQIKKLPHFSDDFSMYTVGSYIENDATFKKNWVNNVLKGGEAQGMDAHLINIAKIEYESANSDNKVLHLNNTVGNDSFFHIGPKGDYRTKNFTVGFRLKYLVEGVGERSWVGISFRKKAEVHYTGTNNLMFTTQRYVSGTQISGHGYAILNGGSPNDLGESGVQGIFGEVLTVEPSTYTVPSATMNEDMPWVDYKLEVNEKNYRLYVNETLVYDCTFDVPSYDYFGYLSLNCCQANVLVDDFYVENNDTELPPQILPLSTPVVTFNQEKNRLEWDDVDGATLYAVYVNDELVVTKARKYYEFAADLAPGTYSVQVKAIADDTFVNKDSLLTEAFVYTVESAEPPMTQEGNGGGCGGFVAGGVFAAVATLGGALLCLKKRKE